MTSSDGLLVVEVLALGVLLFIAYLEWRIVKRK